MSEEDVAGAVESATVLQFKAKPAKKPRAKKLRPANDHDDGVPLDPGGYDPEDMNGEWAVVMLGGKGVMLREAPDAPIEDRVRFLNVDAFRLLYANRFTERRNPNDGKVKAVTWADAFIKARDRRGYNGVEFWPDRDDLDGTDGYYNLWRGFTVTPERPEGATYKTFQDHLLTNVAAGDQALATWIFAWFAQMMQHPRERLGTALVLRGKMGTGKTKVGEVMGSLIQSHFFLVDDPRYITGQFNAHMASCLLLQADEGFWAGDKGAEGRLKGLITAEYQMIESKGVDPIRLKNYVRLLITSNEDWVIPAGRDERRFLVCDVADHVAQNHQYFREMDAELDAGGRELLLADLLAFDLSTVNLRQIPKTAALLEQKLQSLDPFHSWWFERLDSGSALRTDSDWVQSVSRDALYDDYIAFADRIGIKRKLEKHTWGRRLHAIMPELGKTRRTAGLDGFAGRLRLYELPALRDARSDFEISVGQRVTWQDGDFAGKPMEGGVDPF